MKINISVSVDLVVLAYNVCDYVYGHRQKKILGPFCTASPLTRLLRNEEETAVGFIRIHFPHKQLLVIQLAATKHQWLHILLPLHQLSTS